MSELFQNQISKSQKWITKKRTTKSVGIALQHHKCINMHVPEILNLCVISYHNWIDSKFCDHAETSMPLNVKKGYPIYISSVSYLDQHL
jgi:hypothetical protein